MKHEVMATIFTIPYLTITELIIRFEIIVNKLIEKDNPEINVTLDSSFTHKFSICIIIGSRISTITYRSPIPIKKSKLFD